MGFYGEEKGVGMDNSVWLAGIFGPLLAIVGLWRLIHSENLNKVITSVKTTPGLFYLMCFINLLIGLTVLNNYRMWSLSTATLITIYGWLMAIRGIIGFFMPQLIYKAISHRPFLKVWGIVPLVAGLLLCLFAWGKM